MMKVNKIENIHRIYADYEGTPIKIEVDREKLIVAIEYNWTGDDKTRRCFDAGVCTNDDQTRFFISEYANSDHDEDWNCDVNSSCFGSLENDKEILDLVDGLLSNFFEAERAMEVYNKLKKSGVVK